MKPRGLRIDWPGRVWEPGSSGSDCGDLPFPAGPVESGSDRATLVYGDALDVARVLEARGERAHVVYVDPPYASQAEYVAEARLDGFKDGRTRRAVAFGDRWEVGAYLDMLAPRIEAAARLLRDDGTLWVHLDWRSAYLVRVVLDEVFGHLVRGSRRDGRDAFLNEIVWRRAPNLGRQAVSDQFGRTLDTIVVYGRERAKLVPPTRLEPIEARAVRFDEEKRPFTTAPRGDYTDASIAKLEREGRVHRTASGRVYIKYFLVQDARGDFFRERRVDTLWTDVPPLRHAKTSERTGYPTQKPLALLDRIIRSASPEGGLVVDLFCGSGTTAEAAVRASRRAIASDRSPIAIATARSRLLRAGVAPTIERIASDLPRGKARVSIDGRRVTLREPRLPLAWAVDTSGEDVFRATWHAERTLGGPATIPDFVDLERAPEKLRVRAWGDDGTVHEG